MKPRCTFTVQQAMRGNRPYYKIRGIISINGTKTTFVAPYELQNRRQWKNGQVVGTEPHLIEIYYGLIRIKEEIEAIKCDLSTSARMVLMQYNGTYETNTPRTLLGCLRFAIDVRNEDPRISSNTTKDYEKVYNRVKGWLATKKWEDIPLKGLRREHIREYVDYLSGVNGGVAESTAWYHFCVINLSVETTIKEYADDPEMIKYNPIRGAIRRPDKSESRKKSLSNHLTYEEIEQIMNLSIDDTFSGRGKTPLIESEWYKHVLLFQAYSGFSFVDMGHDNWEIIRTIHGLDMILLRRGKNGQESHIPITDELKMIIDKLKSFGGKRLFPFEVFVNPMNYKEKDVTVYNRAYANYSNFMKRLVKKLKWKKKIKSHTMRHTFAMIMLNKYGMTIESLASMLGHTDIKTSQQNYAYVSQDRVAKEFKSKVG